MNKWWEQLKEEYYETRYNSSEDWLEWFIKRKMSWGWRWILVISICILYRIFWFQPRNVFRFFYFLCILGLVYVFYILICQIVRKKR